MSRFCRRLTDINELLCRTKVMLVPSLWAEARSRMILEAMSRGIPVMASNAGGLAEAMLGMDYVLPVNPVTRYRPTMDELMVPAVDIPAQNMRAVGQGFGSPIDGPGALRTSGRSIPRQGLGVRPHSDCGAFRSLPGAGIARTG